MKPTELQIKIAKLVEEQARFWQITNDINSPTHLCDIEESITRDLIDDLNEKERAALNLRIANLYHLIRILK